MSRSKLLRQEIARAPVGAEALAAILTGEGLQGSFSLRAALCSMRRRPGRRISSCSIEMPISDGFFVASFMRGSARFARTPIIAYTSLAGAEVIARDKEVEIDAFCRKRHSPLSPVALIEHVAPLGLS